MIEDYCLCDAGGIVVQVGSCSIGTYKLQEREGLIAYAIKASAGDQIVDGVVVGKADAFLKEKKLSDANHVKNLMRRGGIVVDGILFESDENAISAYKDFLLKVILFDPHFTVENWKASKGVWVTMNKELIEKIMYEWERVQKAAFDYLKSQEDFIKAESES